MIDADKIRDTAIIYSLYKSFPRYLDHTYEDVLEHILPSIELKEAFPLVCKVLGYNKPVKWLRVSDDETIKRMTIKHTKGHYV